MQKKIKMLFRNKPTIGIIASICTIIFVLASTFAWFSGTAARDNEFKTDFDFDVELVDEFEKQETVEPEQLVPKKVGVFNPEELAAFVRVMVFPVAYQTTDDGQVPLPITDGIELVYDDANTTTTFEENKWQLGDDGYYYYLGTLAPGQTKEQVDNDELDSQILFKGVTIKFKDDETKETYRDASFRIVVKSEAVDARNGEYRVSWWNTDKDTAQVNDPLKTIDEVLQTLAN